MLKCMWTVGLSDRTQNFKRMWNSLKQNRTKQNINNIDLEKVNKGIKRLSGTLFSSLYTLNFMVSFPVTWVAPSFHSCEWEDCQQNQSSNGWRTVSLWNTAENRYLQEQLETVQESTLNTPNLHFGISWLLAWEKGGIHEKSLLHFFLSESSLAKPSLWRPPARQFSKLNLSAWSAQENIKAFCFSYLYQRTSPCTLVSKWLSFSHSSGCVVSVPAWNIFSLPVILSAYSYHLLQKDWEWGVMTQYVLFTYWMFLV